MCCYGEIFFWAGQVWWLVFLYPLLVCLKSESERNYGIEKNITTKITVLELYPLSTLAIAVFFFRFLLNDDTNPIPSCESKKIIFLFKVFLCINNDRTTFLITVFFLDSIFY
ncbi:MAG: hypothetical protein CM1200mP16_15430 [Nitrospina sp.]|nr:MAG: hypothetical protein CM1200mP16_15430 [Nitrospina sp.]